MPRDLWAEASALPRIGNLVAKAGSAVSVVAPSANQLDIFLSGSDGKTYTAAWDKNFEKGAWRGWRNILQDTIQPGNSVAAVLRIASSLDIFIVRSDGKIYTAVWDQN